MKFLRFRIQHYKAISELIIDVDRRSLTPIIGVNESGKTSILWGIFAFDHANDTLNEGRHLSNVGNLYKTTDRGEPSVTAEIEISKNELFEIVDELRLEAEISDEKKRAFSKTKRQLQDWEGPILIKRSLKTKAYTVENIEFGNSELVVGHVVDSILERTPYILYFDDFRDTVDEEIEIPAGSSEPEGWLSIIEQLFKRTNPDYSVFDLIEKGELTRQSILADVRKKLNATLSKEWEKFVLDEGGRLDVDIQYVKKEERHFLKLVIKESVGENERFFGILDRSKGFFWFFNFVMKLEFNPKVRGLEDKDTIYLLDEPGSYLHASAQAKLCDKLASLSKNNVVIYCTHTHYLLDPDKIPLSYINISRKRGDGSIELIPLPAYSGGQERRLALQPIIDALKVRPFLADLTHDKICIVEGIYDYYVLEFFKPEKSDIKFLPSVDAASIKFFISIAIAWGIHYVAMWDKDEVGRKERDSAMRFFGDHESEKLILLPSKGERRKYILQDLFAGEDMKFIKSELNIPSNSSFEKTILLLFFSEDRKKILRKISKETKGAARYVFKNIQEILI